jgi:hypothetical protein
MNRVCIRVDNVPNYLMGHRKKRRFARTGHAATLHDVVTDRRICGTCTHCQHGTLSVQACAGGTCMDHVRKGHAVIARDNVSPQTM